MPNHHATSEGNIPFTPKEELEKDAVEAAWSKGARDRKAAEVRAQRDAKLSETDWRFRSDMTPSRAWEDYCQDLRNVPQQSGFPNSVTWPIKP